VLPFFLSSAVTIVSDFHGADIIAKLRQSAATMTQAEIKA